MSGDGLLVLDKPAGWTSHDVVAVARGVTGTRRVGHAGTLDPMATGVLVLGVGRGTRLLTFFVGLDKTYTATIRLGQSTVTDDAEGEVTSVLDASHLTDEQVDGAVATLTGEIDQVPSSVSAIKVGGVRSYARVRSGQEVALAARPVTVSRFEVTGRRGGPADGGTVLDLDVVVEVSSGTYVRALARDLGTALGVGGHLTALRRTRVGRIAVEDATRVEALRQQSADLPLVPLEQAARAAFEVRELTEQEALAVVHGQRIRSPAPAAPDVSEVAGIVAAFDPAGRLVAMLDQSAALARSRVVFPPS